MRTKHILSRILLAALLLSGQNLRAWTKAGTAYTTTGAQSDVISAKVDATAGDTINIPAGTFTWGASALVTSLDKAVTLQGAGEGVTIINLSPTGSSSASGVIQISAAATVSGFTINGVTNTVGGPSTTPFSLGGTTGWRVHHITYNGPTVPGYFAYCGNAFGLFDHCTITANGPSLQTFMVRGATGVWSSPHTMGTAGNVYIEDCTFNGDCYVCEGDGSAQLVLRGNTITGPSMIDQHQVETSVDITDNTYHGGRQIEIGFNRWTYTVTRYFSSGAMDLKAGTGKIYDNIASFTPFILLEAYGTQGTFWNSTFTVPGGGTKYITPAQIPVQDYIGVGPSPRSQGKEPMHFVHNIMNTAGTDTGQSTNINWPVDVMEANVNAGAITQYGSSFLAADIVQKDISYFDTVTSFNGSLGTGRGTKAAMLAINMSGKTNKVGYWVTDEGTWYQKWTGSKAATAIAALDRCTIATVGTTNFGLIGAPAGYAVGTQFTATGPGTGTGTVTPSQGRLYVWNSGTTTWDLDFEPYTYPHPLQSGGGGGGGGDTTAPTPNPATISGTPTHTSSTISVTATTATDETSLGSTPYRFSNNNGSTWSAYQLSASYTWTGLTANTAYQIKVQYQDAAANAGTASSASTVTTDAASGGGTGVPATRKGSGKKASPYNLGGLIP